MILYFPHRGNIFCRRKKPSHNSILIEGPGEWFEGLSDVSIFPKLDSKMQSHLEAFPEGESISWKTVNHAGFDTTPATVPHEYIAYVSEWI